MESAFKGASLMAYAATDAPDLSGVTDMSNMFANANRFNGDLSSWSVSQVTDMSYMFSAASDFDQPLNGWDVSSVTDMSNMFSSAAVFDRPLNGWNVSSVTDMSNMFSSAAVFDRPLNGWNVSSVTDMSNMFYSAFAFNQSLNNWNVSDVTDMTDMFHARLYQNLGNWYVVANATSIARNDVPGVVAELSMQNTVLNGHSTTYGIGKGGDSDLFKIANGNELNMTSVEAKSSYRVNVTTSESSVFENGGNWRVLGITVTESANTAPTVNAGTDQEITEGDTVTLAGTATDVDPEDDLTHVWSHDSALSISLDDSALTPSFTVPNVSEETAVEFTLTVSDGTTQVSDRIIITIIGSVNTAQTADAGAFITTWQTGAAGESITIPVGGATGTYTVDWGDGNTSVNVTGDQTHVYEDAGTYVVRISGDFTRIYLNEDPSNADKLVSIEQWGDTRWESMISAFHGASNMVYRATDVPVLSDVTSMRYMFYDASSFDGNLSGWDVSHVIDMTGAFWGASSFDGDLSSWNVSRVTDMSSMLSGASSFDGNLSGWDVSHVTDMYTMFNQANAFDQNLGKWYIVLDDTVIEGDSATGTVGIIAAQNSFLGAQNPAYGIGSGVDSASFEMDGASLRLKAVSDRLTGDSYTVNVTSSGGFGTNNFRILEVSVKVSGILPATGTDINQTPLAEPTVPPEAPQNLRAASTDTTVTLIWDSPDDDSITGYKILSRTPATQSQLSVLVDDTGAPGTSYVIEDLDPDTVYVFRVIAINVHGESDNSNFVRLSTLS